MILKAVSLVAAVLSSIVFVSNSLVGSAIVEIGVRETSATTEAPDSALLVHARNVAAMSPLDPRPFLIAGLLKERSGDTQAAERLIFQAVRRDPRMTDARFWMLRHHFAAGEIQSGVQEAKVLYQLRPRLGRQISVLLVEAASDPGTRSIIGHRLANTPYLLDIVGHGSAVGLPPSSLLELVRETNLRELPGGIRAVQSAVVREPLARGQYRVARMWWGKVLGRRVPAAVFDGSFMGIEASPPFTWTISTGSTIEARIGANDGESALRVRSFGDLATTVASQTLVLVPGAYTLAYQVSAMEEWSSLSPGFEWRILCSDGSELGESEIQARSRSWRLETIRFSVSAGCSSQTLELRSTGNYPDGTPEVRITRVEVHQAA